MINLIISRNDTKAKRHKMFSPVNSFLNLIDNIYVRLQVHIVQRGAVCPLIEMLQSADVQLREMSAFALGRLAQV
jgi:hypothetical protein